MNMADEHDLEVVKGVQTYKDKSLGSGSYSDVYEGSWNSAPCAVKVFKDKIAKSLTKYNKLLSTEAEKWFRLRHPNIVQFYGLCKDSDASDAVETRKCILLEYLPYNLHEFVEDRFPKSPDENLLGFKCSILVDVALALRYMHSIQMAHRDLTPKNVLLTRSLRAKVTDFGTARFYVGLDSAGVNYTKQSGTIDFMPPEALGEDRYYTPNGFTTDVFSFGCLILFVLVHKWPRPKNKDKFKEPGHNVEFTRTEFERREHHMKETLGDTGKEYFEHLLRTCLDDDPQKRKDVEWIHKQLISMPCYDEKYQDDQYYSKIIEAHVLGNGERNEHGTKETSNNIPSDPQPEQQPSYSSEIKTCILYIILIMAIIVFSWLAFKLPSIFKLPPDHSNFLH